MLQFFALTDFGFWLYLVWFGCAAVVSWYFLGRMLGRQFFDHFLPLPIERFLVGWAAGLAFWGAQAIILGYAQIRFISYFLIVLGLQQTWQHRHTEIPIVRSMIKSVGRLPKLGWLLILVCSIVQLAGIFPSGLNTAKGVDFYFTQAYDGIMHLAYISSAVQQIPPMEPGAPQLAMVNYHYWTDVIMGDLVRVWNIPINHIFFQYVPIFLTLITLVVVGHLAYLWSGQRRARWWAMFLFSFAGDAAFFPILFLQKVLRFDTAVIQSGSGRFFNMPQAFAEFIFAVGMICLWYALPKNDPRSKTRVALINNFFPNWKSWLPTAILMLATTGIKVYFGIFALIGWGWICAINWIQAFWLSFRWPKSRQKLIAITVQYFLLGIILLLVFASIYLPPNRGAGGLFWAPLEWVRIYMGHENLNWSTWWLRMQVYADAHNYRMLAIYYGLGIALTLGIIYGIRGIALLGIWHTWKRHTTQHWLFFLLPSALFIIIALTTLQVSGMFNIFNFFVVTIFPATIWSACAVSKPLKPKALSILLIVFTIAFALPRAINDTNIAWQRWSRGWADQRISKAELAAFAFIRKNLPTTAVLQASAANFYDQDTPYVPYFSQRRPFLSGSGSLNTHNQPVKTTKHELTEIWKKSNALELSSALKDKHITHIYLQKNHNEQIPKFALDPAFFAKLFENEEVIVAEVVR